MLIVRLEQARPGQAVNGDDRPDSLTAGQLDGRHTHRRRWPGRTLDVARYPNPPPAAARSIFTHTAVRTHGLSTRTDLEHRSPHATSRSARNRHEPYCMCKLATGRIGNDPADAAGVLTDAADAIVGIGAELRTNEDNEPLTISARTLVYSRRVLTRAIEGLMAGIWVCPCGEPHRPDADPCTLVQGLTADLNVVGGWLAAPNERPGDQR